MAAKSKVKKTPPPPKRARCLIKDATPEKVAEILARDPSGSLMVHDELAGWLDSFERYSSGQSSRAFHLTCWNGGPFTKDRVGRGAQDLGAEIHVDNLALSMLGGIQPDRLAQLRDLTSDGLMQRFLPVLMKPPERGDEYHFVASAEANYDDLLKSINSAPAGTHDFVDAALEVRDRVLDHLRELELVDGFPAALIAAIGKLKGYFARVCLVLEIAKKHDPKYVPEGVSITEWATPEELARLRKHFGFDLDDNLSAGIYSSAPISRCTAEAAEKLLNDFILPHMFGLYDVMAAGGQDRATLRSIADFILASKKDRLRPSDVTAGVRALRGKPEKTIAEWMGRFCAMGWLVPEEGKPGIPPRAWLVLSGLRDNFKERQKQAQAARAKAHAILRAGGTRRRIESVSDKSPCACEPPTDALIPTARL
jgi:hypothetical protein